MRFRDERISRAELLRACVERNDWKRTEEEEKKESRHNSAGELRIKVQSCHGSSIHPSIHTIPRRHATTCGGGSSENLEWISDQVA